MARPRLFGRLRAAVLGVVHVGALPGTPRSSLPLAQIIDQACQEAEAYKDAGVDGLIVENMHDRPYTLCPGPEVTATMTAVGAAVRRLCPHLALGVQVLCAANQQATAVALAAGLDFIRVEGFVFSHVADEGIINACAGDLLRYRKLVGAENIQIFADIKKKHRGSTCCEDSCVDWVWSYFGECEELLGCKCSNNCSYSFVPLQTSISNVTNCQVPSSTQGVIMMESFLPELTGTLMKFQCIEILLGASLL
ncbi:uncharacterized protein LOC415758 isoform X8 [Gallus gallus]|uniref:uncharacterized protein LOC415758 isoform X8 n=1 Tax=Gallus gallus TaxID=9031 RepID=UPI001EFFBFCD|nr:uncharacterized protein LOC415758 isoform X8 [Gallus gallus]